MILILSAVRRPQPMLRPLAPMTSASICRFALGQRRPRGGIAILKAQFDLD